MHLYAVVSPVTEYEDLLKKENAYAQKCQNYISDLAGSVCLYMYIHSTCAHNCTNMQHTNVLVSMHN